MISPNIEALKKTDICKWDLQKFFAKDGALQMAMNVFNYSGEPTEEYKENSRKLITQLMEIKGSLDLLCDEATKIA